MITSLVANILNIQLLNFISVVNLNQLLKKNLNVQLCKPRAIYRLCLMSRGQVACGFYLLFPVSQATSSWRGNRYANHEFRNECL